MSYLLRSSFLCLGEVSSSSTHADGVVVVTVEVKAIDAQACQLITVPN